MKRFLVIQTAFIGDVVLALPVAQRLHQMHPGCEVHFVVRRGNENLLQNHPCIQKTWIWDKKHQKIRNLLRLVKALRRIRFDEVYNLHRFGSSGFLTWRLKAGLKVGFDKNPWSRFYDRREKHAIPFEVDGAALHEVQRNLLLTDGKVMEPMRPLLYPSASDFDAVKSYAARIPYVVIAPASVWFTKQLPASKWKELMARFPAETTVYLAGAGSDSGLADSLLDGHPKAENLCGRLTLLQSAALMKNALRVYANDSAPLHFASAMNAPVTAFFCSTLPEFGFGPLSEDAEVIEVKGLECRPCGLHGYRECPKGHYKCGNEMPVHLAKL